jgi:hypothetical protein
MKLLYDNLLRTDQTDLNPADLSTLMQAWSKSIVPARVIDHFQTYELEIGDIVYLHYVSPDKYQIKRLSNVIDQLGEVPEHPEWKHTWHHCPRRIAISGGVTRYILERVLSLS